MGRVAHVTSIGTSIDKGSKNITVAHLDLEGHWTTFKNKLFWLNLIYQVIKRDW